MYANLIYFLLVLLVFTSYEPDPAGRELWWVGLTQSLCTLVFFWMMARTWFGRLRRRAEKSGSGAVGLGFHRLQTRMSIIALILFTLDVYFFGLKDFFLALPLVESSSALTGLAGVAAFSAYLAVLWSEAHPVYRLAFTSRLGRIRFVISQLRFNLPIILPWLFMSLAGDLITLLPPSKFTTWLETPLGEIAFDLFFVLLLVVFIPVFIRPLWGLKPLPAGPQRGHLVEFCRKIGFKYREIMLWPLYEGEGLTAGVMGIFGRWRFILVTKSLLRILTEGELEAVMAHELGHVRRLHLVYYLCFFLLFFVLAALVLAPILLNLNFYLLTVVGGAMDWLVSTDGPPGPALSLFLSAPLVVVLILYFRFILGAYMRNFEREADLYGYKLTGSIDGLVGSLEKIAWYSGQSRDVPSWHHYSVAQRVDFLKACASDPSLVTRHLKKVRRMVAGYFLIVLLLGGGGAAVHRAGWVEEANTRLMMNVIEAEIKRAPQRAETYRFLGDVYFQQKRLDQAMDAYEKALALQPLDPETLNNLAWLLITEGEPSPADLARGLDLARQAALIRPAPHILDTYAEALFLNGRTELALSVIEQALAALSPAERDQAGYLLKQRAKFARALEQGGTSDE